MSIFGNRDGSEKNVLEEEHKSLLYHRPDTGHRQWVRQPRVSPVVDPKKL